MYIAPNGVSQTSWTSSNKLKWPLYLFVGHFVIFSEGVDDGRQHATVCSSWQPGCLQWLLLYQVRDIPSKHKTLLHYWFNIGPASQTLGQQWTNTGSLAYCFFLSYNTVLTQSTVMLMISKVELCIEKKNCFDKKTSLDECYKRLVVRFLATILNLTGHFKFWQMVIPLFYFLPLLIWLAILSFSKLYRQCLSSLSWAVIPTSPILNFVGPFYFWQTLSVFTDDATYFEFWLPMGTNCTIFRLIVLEISAF